MGLKIPWRYWRWLIHSALERPLQSVGLVEEFKERTEARRVEREAIERHLEASSRYLKARLKVMSGQ